MSSVPTLTNQEVHALEHQATIHRVLVMEDRAQVTRRGTISLPAGLCRVRVHGISPLCVERSLRLRRESSQPLQILELRLVHEILSKRQQETDLQKQIEATEHEMAQLHEETFRKQQHVEILEQTQEKLLQQIQRQAGANQADTAAWHDAIHKLRERKEAIHEAIHALQQTLNAKSELRIQQDEKLLQAAQPAPELRVHLEALLEVSEAHEATLAWDYLVPCALWRPVHQAHLILAPQDEGKASQARAGHLDFETSAMIWQRTGEDWKDVLIACSTARTTQAASPPLLDDEVLTSRKKTTEEQKTIVASFRNEARQRTGQAAPKVTVPCVDDGGEARYFEAKQPASIPSNGQPVRISLFSWRAKTEASLICTPEVQSAVMLRTEQINEGPHPILAGPVRLIRQSGYIGQTSILYTAPQETFALGWGSEDRLRVQRDVVLLRDTQGFSGRQL
ncbi:MAG: mucoidy inhibitor MuiA family protein, partial [Myxococcales bacterium]|nr:mucoidy inhibitor MuiA family protein [Myxococcales bacterium]